MAKEKGPNEEGMIEIFTPYIIRKGKKIMHPTGGLFHFFVKGGKKR